MKIYKTIKKETAEKVKKKIREFDMAGNKYVLGQGVLCDGNLKDDLIKEIFKEIK